MRALKKTFAAAAVAALAVAWTATPARAGDSVAGYQLSALGVGVRYQFNVPGLLPVGDPAEGNIMELDVPIARTLVGSGPVINALASPAYPGDTAAHLGTALETFGVPFEVPNDPILAEANYPPSPDNPAHTSFSQAGVGEGTSDASAAGAKVVARTVSQSIPGVLEIGSATGANDVRIAGDAVRSIATATASSINIAGLITIDGVTGTADAASDGTKGTPTAQLNIGKVTVAGQPAYIDRDGVHVVGNPLAGAGVVAGLQSTLNAALGTDGLTVRTIEPTTTVDGASAKASSGALAITIDRFIPAIQIPGLASVTIPGGPTEAVGTPDLPTHTDIFLGLARVDANATALPSFLDDLGVPTPPVVSGDTFSAPSDSFTAVTGPGSSLGGALGLPAQAGSAALGQPASSERGTGRGIPVGWIIVGIFGAFVISGPLLGYARWQLLEGRHS